MKTTTIVAIILGVLVLVSVVQAFQLNGLKEKLAEGQLGVSSSGSNTGAAASSGSKDTAKRTTTSLPSSVKNLPQMVGGC